MFLSIDGGRSRTCSSGTSWEPVSTFLSVVSGRSRTSNSGTSQGPVVDVF
jgi:hypothetical protein